MNIWELEKATYKAKLHDIYTKSRFQTQNWLTRQQLLFRNELPINGMHI